VPPKLYLRYHSHLDIRQVPKFRRATPPKSEVISANLLHFKPIFDSPLKKIVSEPSFPVGGALVRLCHFLARLKIWGRSTPQSQNMVFRIMRFWWV